MNYIFALLFRSPWWVFVLLAGGVVYLGEDTHQTMLKKQAARVEALQSPPPEPLDLSVFTKEDITPVGEVNVRGWINYDLNYNLIKRTNMVKTGERFVYVMFGQNDGKSGGQARAAIILTKDQKQVFLDQVDGNMVDFGPNGVVYGIHGLKSSGDGYYGQLASVLREKDVRMGADFIMIEPFLEGRAAGLTRAGEAENQRLIYLGVVGFLLLVALFKFRKSRRRKQMADVFADGPISSGTSKVSVKPTGLTTGAQAPADMPAAQIATSSPRADTITDDSPLGRMQRREAAKRGEFVDPNANPEARSTSHAPLSGLAAAYQAKPLTSRPSMGFLPKLVGAGAVLFLLGQLGLLPMAFPIMMLVGFWYAMHRGATLLGSGLSRFNGLFSGAGHATTRAKMAVDPLDKLAHQVRE